MRLSNTTKELVVGNETLIKYCKSSGIDHKKLKNCSIEKMGDNYIFTLKKENMPKSNLTLPLDIDLDTQPDIVLIMNVNRENGKITFESTNDTIRIINR